MHGAQPGQSGEISVSWVAVFTHRVDATCQANTARLIAFKFKDLRTYINNLRRQPPCLLRRKRPLMAGTGIGVHGFATQPIAPRQLVGGGDHVHPGSRVVQRFPEKVLELHLGAKAETATMGIGRNRIA
ncbi:hypothetical protein D3C76_1258190 [compost metagenome]